MLTPPIDRRILSIVEDRLAEAPVVVLQGARSVGKSTVLAELARRHDVEITDLDDVVVRARVQASPSDAVRGPSPVCIDEHQHVPELLQAIKAELNRRHDNGRWLLTGSASFWAMPRGTQALTGRVQLLEVMPFSQGELDGVHEDFFDLALADPAALVAARRPVTERDEYERRACRGGMPLAVRATDRQRANFYRSYLGASLARDVLDLSRVRQINVLPRLMERLTAQTGQVLNVVKAATAAGIEPRSADNYTRLLEALFLIRRLPAWGRTLRSRTAHSPKLHVVDSGLAAYLLGITPEKLARRNPSALAEFGHLFETFVVGELLKQASWRDDIRELGHWRTHDGQEVDLVAETLDGTVVGFEIKAGREVDTKSLRGLVALRDSLGDEFRAGYFLNTGSEAYQIDDRIHVCPIDRLWQTNDTWIKRGMVGR
ncbi:MAG: hypothetical protein RLZZ623_2219 [Actinomycetota bacterium]|jgi:uncharacterized protein